MWAIAFTEANLPKILQTDNLSVAEAEGLTTALMHREYVFIRGYYSDRGRMSSWEILPWFFFKQKFDFDPETIATDWDQTVRLT